MKIVCIKKSSDEQLARGTVFTKGKIYDAIPDRDSSIYNAMKQMTDVNMCYITDDNGHVATYNFNPDSGVWLYFTKLEEYRSDQLDKIFHNGTSNH